MPQPPPDRVRPARGDADPRDAGGDLRRRDRRPPRRAASASCRRTTTATTTAVIAATVWHGLVEPWQQGIDRRALLEVVLLGLTGGALGCWIIFYNLSYSTESLAHALLPGLVLAALAGHPADPRRRRRPGRRRHRHRRRARTPAVGRDTAVAVVVTGLLGLGALLALSPDTPAGLGELLFGDVLGVSDTDLALAAGARRRRRSLALARPPRPPAARRLRPPQRPRARRQRPRDSTCAAAARRRRAARRRAGPGQPARRRGARRPRRLRASRSRTACPP